MTVPRHMNCVERCTRENFYRISSFFVKCQLAGRLRTLTLEDYQRKRDFRKSPEPASGPVSHSSHLRFCVQKHDARNLHFDFRIEYNGALKSWAVPRGPSLDPAVKRLAVEVEDHPLAYLDFEGVIPAGNYGAGKVVVWDIGIWQPNGDAEKMLRDGRLKFQLFGSRLRGEWLLIRTSAKGKQQQWLLSKRNDKESRTDVDIVATELGSVLAVNSATAIALPDFVAPKLPTLTTEPPRGKQWIHELKVDGYRMQAQWRHDGFRLLSRNGHDMTQRYKVIADEFSKLDWEGTIVDGELAAIQEDGRSNFDLMQQKGGKQQEATLAYFAFDLLYLRGQEQRENPLFDRKAALKSLIDAAKATHVVKRLQYLDHVTTGEDKLIAYCQSMGLEGIVSKRIDSNYKSGRASDWLKTKFRYRESLVIVSYETSANTSSLSSLVVGYYDQEGKIQLAGRVGTGWNEKNASLILRRLDAIKTDKPATTSKLPASQRGVPRDVKLHWIQPLVVADIEFANWTEARQLRQAAFAGFNEDISAMEVSAEQLFAEQASPTEKVKSSKNSKRTSGSANQRSTASEQQLTGLFPGLTHPIRVLFPKDQFTKADIATYLFKVNQWLLPHLANRPVSLLRCSDGISGQTFFQRHPGKGFPASITRLEVKSEEEPLLSIDNLAALLAAIQISAIELHPWGCQSDDIEHPDRVIIDLDPDESLAWTKVVEAAFIVRSELDNRALRSFVKTTGGKGLHIVIPLTGKPTWDDIGQFSRSLAQELTKAHKTVFVDNMSKARRRDRIFVDYHRNRRGSTAVAAYSVRARDGAPVSTPVTWDELPSLHPSQFTIQTVPQRLAQISADPWQDIDVIKQRLND